ncbi:MAG: hypothetical protein U9O83_07335, partial [Campylobacterota bacterium]|nr:hypothetical protein [Campylobacterota bacterium]
KEKIHVTGNPASSSHIRRMIIDYFERRGLMAQIPGDSRLKPLFPGQNQEIDIILLKDEKQKVFNLNDGAKFIETIPKRADELSLNQPSKDIKKYLFKICSEHSSIGFSTKELDTLNDKLKHAKEMQNILTKHKQLKKSKAHYLESLKELSKELCTPSDMRKYELSRVLDTYLKYILGYVFDFYNSKDMQRSRDKIQKLDDLLTSELLKITDFYCSTLKQKGDL